MWQFLLAAAVAGSTSFAAKHFLKPTNTQPVPDNTSNCHQPLIECQPETENGIFTFSSSRSLTQDGSSSNPKNSTKNRRRSKSGIRVAKVELRSAEHRKRGKRRRKTINSNNIAGKPAFCSSKDGSLFSWGVSFGMMCMMAGKSEISELNKTITETTKVVEELKSELKRRKSPRSHQDSVGNAGMESRRMSDRNEEIMLKETNSELRETDVKIWSLPVNDEGECGSSALTEESGPLVLEMDQLEAELEFEIQKLPGCTIDTNHDEEIRPKLDEVEVPNEGCHGANDKNLNSYQYQGILASELNQKLSQLLIQQQENQIGDLESELNLAQCKLQEKEAELQALKDCVRHLTKLPLSTVSDDETDAVKGTIDWNSNATHSGINQSIVGVKRPLDSESCVYYP
ncbi:uncharacterized protein LOC130730371 [Lotus japonicus]|uniref:uncharacterized protein LOC130730371 n=1 Tax=Lotus japonicus TaxID=34305 RepID=UPI00258A1441|nr:uncharacterized protein LOC130730371 [Lotus japonicus]